MCVSHTVEAWESSTAFAVYFRSIYLLSIYWVLIIEQGKAEYLK